ncbi:MAG: YigZ family protein [Bacilli bacterium]
MIKLNESYLEIKKSKFIGLVYKIDSTTEVDEIISRLKKEHKKARHIVYAFKLGGSEKNYADKEPSGTTRGLIDIIHRKNLDNVLIVVIRYFGGILLGSGPLTRTYTKVASMLFIE